MESIVAERKITFRDLKVAAIPDSAPQQRMYNLQASSPRLPDGVIQRIIEEDLYIPDPPVKLVEMKQGISYFLDGARDAVKRTFDPPKGKQDWTNTIFDI